MVFKNAIIFLIILAGLSVFLSTCASPKVQQPKKVLNLEEGANLICLSINDENYFISQQTADFNASLLKAPNIFVLKLQILQYIGALQGSFDVLYNRSEEILSSTTVLLSKLDPLLTGINQISESLASIENQTNYLDTSNLTNTKVGLNYLSGVIGNISANFNKLLSNQETLLNSTKPLKKAFSRAPNCASH